MQSQAQVECLATHVVVIGVIRIAPIDRHVEIELQAIRQGEPEVGIHHQQRGIALVALVVEIERVGGSQVLALVALPGENAVVVGSYLEARHLAEIHQADGLHAVAAAHVVVAVYHIIIIGETAAQQMQSRDERLVAAQAEGGIQREVIVWLGGDAIKRVAIYQIESHVWISLATEQRVVIGKIAITR